MNILLVVLCLGIYLLGLASIPPIDRDEARFAQATRQMVESGDYLRIKFQDNPRHKKPVGIHWLQSAAVNGLAGASVDKIWPYRLPSIIGAIAAVLLTFGFGRQMFSPQVALTGAAFLATSLLLVMEAHLATTDAALLAAAAGAQGSLGLLYLAQCNNRPSKISLVLLFWFSQSLGILLKGPALPACSLLTLFSLSILERSASLLRKLKIEFGLPLTVAFTLFWAIPLHRASGGTIFFDAFWNDLLPKLVSQQETHGFPPGFYLASTCLTFWPASLFAGVLLAIAKDMWQQRSARFCIIWLVPTWLVLECIPTKLPHYILPALPALALLTAQALESSSLESFSGTKSRFVYFGWIVWLGVGLTMACAIVLVPWYLNGNMRWVTLIAALSAVVALLATSELFRRHRLPAACCSSVMAAICLLAPSLHIIVPDIDALWLSRSVARALEIEFGEKWHAKVGIAVSGYEEPSIVFALGTNTKLISPSAAAEHMRATDCAAAVINAELKENFLEHLDVQDASVSQIAVVRGFNYTKGQWTTLHIYVKDKHC